MDKQSIKDTAKELGYSEDEVREVISSMERLVRSNIKRSSTEESWATRIMGFGTFLTISDNAIKKIQNNEGKKKASGSDV